jgi:hypothetical protein
MSVWEHLDELSDAELKTVTALAAEVLAEGDETNGAISPLAAARIALPPLQSVEPSLTMDDVQRALESEKHARTIALAVLREVGAIPQLAAEVDARLEERSRKLSAPEMLFATGALLVLAIKLKEVRFTSTATKREVVVRFAEASAVLRSAIADIVGLFRP